MYTILTQIHLQSPKCMTLKRLFFLFNFDQESEAKTTSDNSSQSTTAMTASNQNPQPSGSETAQKEEAGSSGEKFKFFF